MTISKDKNNPLLALQRLGQSIWLDYLGRGAITSGQLRQLIENDGLSGVTSNPSIFEKAITETHDYDDAIDALVSKGKSAAEIYQALTVEDIQQTADLFRPVYDCLDGRDGFVSLEVSPHLAHDTDGSIAEARRLWSAVNRANILIKVPATRAGLPAIQQLISEGINVNITLLFGLQRYRLVAEAYLAGLEARARQGKPLKHVASVASFFLSRIDVLVDPMLETIAQARGAKVDLVTRLHGQVAIASARVARQIYREIFLSERFQKLVNQGARSQRLLWASTSTKNPAYPDLKYVEPLIGPETINTLPLETLGAYRDHGEPEARLDQDGEQARGALQQLPELGINIDQVTQQLEDEGVEKFNRAFDKLINALSEKSVLPLTSP
jgi:transaldolase